MANIIKDNELHRIVATSIIYNNENRFLFTKRSPNKKVYPNKWTVPGGGVEVSDYIDMPKDNILVLTLSYYAKYKSGDIVLEERDAVEYKWITLDEGKDLDLIPGILEEIEMTDKIIRSNNNI